MTRPRIGVIGGGSAAEQLARSIAGRADITIFEPGLIGGECPFFACMPSKSMLHDARSGTAWDDAISRRDEITDRLDDSDHARQLRDLGVEIVRANAEILDPSRIDADGRRYHVDHVVIATGAEPNVPRLDGPVDCVDAVWTSEDVYTSVERPNRVAIIGGGVIGFELADLYSRFGSDVTVLEQSDRPLDTMPPAVAEVVVTELESAGVRFRSGVEATSIDRGENGRCGRLGLSDGSSVDADRVIAAIGRRPRLAGVGIDALGLDPEQPLPLEPNGRVRCDGSVWAMGDAASLGQYTHVANHHAEVVADHLVGTATRTFDEVTVSSCMFTTPPLIQVGETWADVADDPDVVSTGQDLRSFPRATTDELGDGHLWMGARRSTGTIVGAAGAGPRFDELVHAIVVAIDGQVPVARLRRSMQPFPTIGEILGVAWDDLHDRMLDS